MKTCQTCIFRATLRDDSSNRQYCKAERSLRSKTGYVRIQASDKACNMYAKGEHTKLDESNIVKRIKKTKMIIIKFTCDDLYYVIAAESKEQAEQHLREEWSSEAITSTEEIPESKWDVKDIKVYPENNLRRKPFKISLREAICLPLPELIYTNDDTYMD